MIDLLETAQAYCSCVCLFFSFFLSHTLQSFPRLSGALMCCSLLFGMVGGFLFDDCCVDSHRLTCFLKVYSFILSFFLFAQTSARVCVLVFWPPRTTRYFSVVLFDVTFYPFYGLLYFLSISRSGYHKRKVVFISTQFSFLIYALVDLSDVRMHRDFPRLAITTAITHYSFIFTVIIYQDKLPFRSHSRFPFFTVGLRPG